MRLHKWVLMILLFSLIFTFTFAPAISAEEEKKPPTYEKIKKDFDCGALFDPVCHVKLWMVDIAMEIFDSVLGFVKNSSNVTSAVIENSTVKRYYSYFKDTSQVLIGTFFLFHLVKILSYYWIDQDTQRFKSLMNKLIITTVMIAGYEWSFTKLLDVTKESVQGLDADLGQFELMFIFLITPQASFIILLFLVMAILILIISFQVLIRSAEIAFMYITGPFAIATNLNEEFNLFTPWWRTFLSLMITQFVQVLLLFIFVELFSNSSAKNIGGVLNYYVAIGFMFLIIKSPSFIKEFMYSTGVGQAAMGMTTKTASAVGKQLIRRITIKK